MSPHRQIFSLKLPLQNSGEILHFRFHISRRCIKVSTEVFYLLGDLRFFFWDEFSTGKSTYVLVEFRAFTCKWWHADAAIPSIHI